MTANTSPTAVNERFHAGNGNKSAVPSPLDIMDANTYKENLALKDEVFLNN